jgi:hypothetical protein
VRITGDVYHILLRIDETAFTPDGASGVELAEVLTCEDDAAAEIVVWKTNNPGTDGVWLRWTALNGVTAGGATKAMWAQLHRLIIRREMPAAFRAALLEGIALAVRMDTGEFSPDRPSSVKGSPNKKKGR